ncbi:MAG: Lrp/AsnC family transcriptional regulator [Ilumatobacteraceae bacterium]
MSETGAVDALDLALIESLAAQPRLSILERSRQLGVARGTVQARLDKLQSRHIVTGFGPDLDPVALGYAVLAFVTLETDQSDLTGLTGHLESIPEVLEAHTTSGGGDYLVKVVARTNADLQRVLNGLLAHPTIVRTSTAIALSTPLPMRTLPLARAASA